MIDAETSMKNESRLIQQFSKPQQPMQESEMNNQEAVRKAIKKYQSKINQMLKVIKSQKNQNDHLKGQLKSLNQHLNTVINKLNHKSIKNSPDSSKDDTLKKQLDNQIKKNVLLQKQLQQLRLKVKGIDSQKIQEMQSEIKQKDRKLDELGQQIKMYEKIEKQERSMDIYKKQEQLVNKVNSLNQQILHLKSKLTKQKKQQEMHQKMMKRQHQQILNLQSKTKNLSQLAKSPEKEKVQQKSNQTVAKSQSANKLNYLKQKYVTNQTAATSQNDKNIKGKNKKSEKQLLTEKISQLEQRCQNLQVTKKAVEKHLKFQVQTLKNKIKILENQLHQSKNVLKRKDQEANILISKVKQSQRKNYSTLEPVQKVKLSQDFGSHALFDQRKEFRGLVHTQGNYRKYDDTEGLSLEKNYRIKNFIFTWFEEHILSLDTTYQLKDGSQKQVSSFKLSHQYKNIKSGGLQLSDFEYIKQVELYCGKFIQFIRIQTSRDKVLEVGNQKNRMKCKKFEFDIRTNEKPIAFLGAIDNKKIVGVEGNKQLLISFGLQIKKKDVVGKSRYNPSRTASLVKNSSKSALQNQNKNDKNIVDDQ